MVLGRVQLEGFGPTRNRKVVGSNPTSGSKPQVRGYSWHGSLRSGDGRHSFGWTLRWGECRCPLRKSESVWLIECPSEGPPGRRGEESC